MDRRQWLKSAVFAAGALGAGTAAAEAPAPGLVIEAPGRSGADYGPALARLARYAGLHLETFGLPGITLAVADRDGFRAVLTLGLADVDRREAVTPAHLFQIGSISKSFVALSILKLADEGRLNLDAALADLLPDAPLPATPRFTLRQVLNHSTGLPDDAPIFPRGGDGRLWCGFAPGKRLSYSNTGFNLLGLLLERTTRRSMAEVIQATVLTPLGMTAARPVIRDSERALYATGYAPFYRDRAYLRRDRLAVSPWTPVAWGAGSVAATPGDMARYIAFLIEAGQGRGGPVLSDAGAARFSTPTIDAPIFGPGAKYASGMGVVPLNGRMGLHHTGGMIAFSSSIHVDPTGGVGAFASTNARVADGYRPRLITAYACALMDAVRTGKSLPEAAPLPPTAPVAPGEVFPGPMISAAGEAIELKAVGGAAVLRWNGADLEIERPAPDVLLVRHPRFAALPITLNRKDGRIVSAWWGPTLFAADPAARTPAPVPPALQALAGRYDNNDPWSPGVVRVIARADGLWVDGATPLLPQPDGSWKPGPETDSPERVLFDAPLNGRAFRMTYSGVDLLRTGDELTD